MGNTYLTGFIPWRPVGQEGKKKQQSGNAESVTERVCAWSVCMEHLLGWCVCVSRAHDGIQEHTDIYHNTAACDPFHNTDAAHQPKPPNFGCVSG